MELVVSTFNTNNQRGARSFLYQRVKPQVALLQEANGANWPGALFPVPVLAGRTRDSASGIDAPGWIVEPLPSEDLGSSAPAGTIAAATIAAPGQEAFTAISAYAQINDGKAYPTAHAIVDDLEPLLSSSRAGRLILGGDLNSWDQFDRTAQDRRVQKIWRRLWERLDGHGLVNILHATRSSRPRLDWCRCGLGDDCWHVPTVRRMRAGMPAHCDYLFTSRWFAERLISCEVVELMDPHLVRASDHAPVTARFDLGE